MSRHFTIRHGLRNLLKFKHLEVHAFTFVGHDEERIHWTLGSTSLVTERKHVNRHGYFYDRMNHVLVSNGPQSDKLLIKCTNYKSANNKLYKQIDKYIKNMMV